MEKQKLNTTVVYVLSILGFLCCCFAGFGVLPAGIAYYMANSKMKEVNADPDAFENGNAMKTAKTVALVALILNALYLIWTIYRWSTIGYEESMDIYRNMMDQFS